MAIISCPGCGKRISDRQISCPHCGFALGGADLSKQERDDLIERARVRKKRQLIYRIEIAAVAVVTVFAALFAAYFFYGEDLSDTQRLLYYYGFAGLSIGFIGLRGWRIWINRRG